MLSMDQRDWQKPTSDYAGDWRKQPKPRKPSLRERAQPYLLMFLIFAAGLGIGIKYF